MPQLDSLIIADQVSLVIIAFVTILVVLGVLLLPIIRLRALCYNYLSTSTLEYGFGLYVYEYICRLGNHIRWSGPRISN